MYLLRKNLKSLLLLCGAAAGFLMPFSAAGGSFSDAFKLDIKLPERNSKDLHHARADQWRLSGKTLFVKGNVYIPHGDLAIRADSAMIDLESKDIEAKGNITFSTVKTVNYSVTVEELERLRRQPDLAIRILGIEVDPLGNQKLQVAVSRPGSAITAERLSGNLLSGQMSFTDLKLRSAMFFCKAGRGVRQPGGELKLEDLEVATCDYLKDDQSHFSISMSTANLYPHETEGFGFENFEREHSQYSLWGYNSFLRIYGVPVFWLPMIYTPKDESPGLFSSQIGYTSDWGFFILATKKFQLMEYPNVETSLDLDFYSKRGLGYGERTQIVTENSMTELDAYGIYDNEPYESSGDEDEGRFEIPHQRFDFHLAHRTHITPRLDIRAQVEWMSDPYMLDDFFSSRAYDLTEPASYVALEYQGDRFSSALYTRFQVNDFFTTVQKLPEFRLDIPRQEIIPGWNIYYQGSHTADYLRMNWARFDRDWKNPESKLKNYETGRFDSVNFIYYPLRTAYFNIVPRAGLRMTGYTDTSETKISQKDIFAMQMAMDEDEDFGQPVKNYQDTRDGKFRVIAEFGAEANTKIYNTWQNVRSDFLGLDGLRHICEPYVNYTFITDPTVKRDRLLFFDEIDRLSELHFIRFGMRNRLQTRRGGFQDASVYEWFSMENYWDLYINDDDNFNHIGDFCTKLTFNPTEQLSFTGFFSIDAGNNQTHDVEATRGNRKAGRPHISGNFFNRLYLQMLYKPIEDIRFTLTYDYKDACIGRAAYSMGSSLTDLDAGGMFDQYFVPERTQTISFGVSLPLTPDRKTFGSYSIAYDFEEGGFTRQVLAISRLFHCVKLSAMVEFERDRDSDNDVDYETSFAVQATLVGLEDPLDRVRRGAVSALSGIK